MNRLHLADGSLSKVSSEAVDNVLRNGFGATCLLLYRFSSSVIGVVAGGNARISTDASNSFSPVFLHVDPYLEKQYAFVAESPEGPSSIDLLTLYPGAGTVLAVSFPYGDAATQLADRP